ncbi:MFS transporter, partial [Acinetobacter baumannii]|nr:MFS transporter [Acinetobacter baumannii]
MNNDVQVISKELRTTFPSNLGTYEKIGPNTWKWALLFAYFAMVVDGIDIMLLSYSLTSLKAEFGLSTFQAGALGSASLAGMGIGGILGGWACDKFGRVRTIANSVTFFSVATCLLGFTQSFEQFMALRFIGALGIGALYMACNTLMAEYVPTTYRTTVLGTLQTGQTVGYIAATLLAGAIIPDYGWRVLFFLTVVPAFVNIFLQRFVPEPKSWQLTKIESLQGNRQPKERVVAEKPKSSSIYKQIFNNFKHRKMFLLWMTTAFFLQFGYYGINNWMPSYLETEVHMNFKNLTSYMVGSYTAMILGKILAGYLADKFNRRAVFVFGTIASAVFLPIIIFFNTP